MQIEVFEDHAWADRVATRWISHMSHRPDSRICLPTGETPRPVYARSAPQVDLSEATIFLLDEFDLPLGDAARCDSMLKRDLLGSLTKPPGAYHQLDVNAADPETECARFDALVGDGGLRLTLLGLGGNGHLGLNEPGTAPDSPTRPVRLTPTTTQAAARYDAAARPVAGLTLGMQLILGSDEIWLLATGSHKAAVLGEMMNDPITPNLPASYLRNHTNTIIFADSSAAAGL